MISVLVIAGTGRHYLSAALGSLVAQDMCEWEAIVVECCDTADDTAKIHAQIQEVHDDRIRLFPYDAERGWPPYASRKWNWALKRAAGSLVAFLDDDDMKGPGWLGAMCAPLVGDDSIDVTLCRGRTIDKDGNEIGPFFGHPSLDYNVLLTPSPITTGQLVIRRRTLKDVGGFDGDLPCSEDWDLCLRLSKYSWRYIEHVVMMHRVNVDNACYHPTVDHFTKEALRTIIFKHGLAMDRCWRCGASKDTTRDPWCGRCFTPTSAIS